MLNHYLRGEIDEVKKKGLFIVIEGLDGSGKSTQAKILVRKLRQSHGAIYTAEPSHGKIGTFIRNRILYGEKRYFLLLTASTIYKMRSNPHWMRGGW
jgi:thymidylate kinase